MSESENQFAARVLHNIKNTFNIEGHREKITRLESEISTLKAQLSAAERVIEAGIHLKIVMGNPESHAYIKALEEYHQLTQRKED